MPGKPNAGGVDILGLVYLGVLFLVLFFPVLLGRFLTSRPGPPNSETDEGPGRGQPWPPGAPRPPGSPLHGLPLPDAEPAQVRIRSHSRLRDGLRPPQRRPVRDPDRGPVRTKVL